MNSRVVRVDAYGSVPRPLVFQKLYKHSAVTCPELEPVASHHRAAGVAVTWIDLKLRSQLL